MVSLRLTLFAVILVLGATSSLAALGTLEASLISAWAARTRSSGWNITTDFCTWRGFTCDGNGNLATMLINPVTLGSLIYGDVPDIPTWWACKQNGTAFTNTSLIYFTNYRTGPRLPVWYSDYYANKTTLNFFLDTTPSLVCYDDPCPFQAVKPPGAAQNPNLCQLPDDYAFSINITCSNANIVSRRPDHGPQAGGTSVVIAVNLPLGFLDMTVSFGHLDGWSQPVPVEQLYFFSYIWRELNNTNTNFGGVLVFFTSVIVVTSPPHPPGGVPLHIYVGNDRVTKSFDMLYYYECPPGTISTFRIDPVTMTNESYCEPCPPGFYSTGFGEATCNPCPAGSYNELAGQDRCVLCPAGTYSAAINASSASTCQDCPPGSANPLAGQSSCTNCRPGEQQPRAGQTECLLCPGGYYTATNSSVNCTICPPGQYQPLRGQDTCYFCPVGEYAPSAGSTTCFPCLPGNTTSGRGATFCDVTCGPGFHRPRGASFCIACAAGTFTNASGLSVCTLCPATRYNAGPNNSQCYECPTATTNYRGGSTSCEPILIKQTQDDNSLLIIGILLVIVAVVVLICGVSYVVARRRDQQKKRKELKKLRELMALAPSSQ